MSEYLQYQIAAFLSRVLPLGFAYWLGLRLGDWHYFMLREDRLAVQANLRRILQAQDVVPAEKAIEGLSRKVFQYFGKYLVDFFRFARLTNEDVRRLVSIRNGAYLDACHARGRGVILVTAHIGNWELGGAVVVAGGYTLHAVVFPERVRKVNRMFQHQRELRGIKPIPLGRSVYPIIKCLRRGEVVALLADRDFTAHGACVDFFGRPVRLPQGPAWLSMKTGAPILPAFLLRQVDDSFLLHFHPPILPEEAGTVEAIQQRIAEALEREIGAHPHQWFIFDDFWKTQAPVVEGKG